MRLSTGSHQESLQWLKILVIRAHFHSTAVACVKGSRVWGWESPSPRHPARRKQGRGGCKSPAGRWEAEGPKRTQEGAGPFPLGCARGAIDTGRQSQPSLPKRSQGSDGGGPLARTADIARSTSHTARLRIHRQARFPHGRIKCCSNALDVRDRHRKVTPRP